MAADIPRLQDYPFQDERLRLAALRHRSAGSPHNERLEFLGDAVLNMVIADVLFDTLPGADEGDLTRLRAHLVRGETLAQLAGAMDLGRVIEMGPGELKSGGHQRASIRADALEALLGAIYRDAGFATVRQTILEVFAGRLAQLPDAGTLKDAKTRLQEFLQAECHDRPEYQLLEESGPPHRRHFVVSCRVGDEQVRGEGGSRRRAEQDAARRMFERLGA